MTHVVAPRVAESSTTTGTGALTLAGALTGHVSFSSVCSVGDTVLYSILADDNSWEVGYGTYSATNELTRTTPMASSNAGAAVTFAAGTKQVFIAHLGSAAAFAAADDKASPVAGDLFGLADSAAGFRLKSLSWEDLLLALEDVFNGLYPGGSGSSTGTNTGDETLASIKTKLGITMLSGDNTGDQTSIVGITGTITEFNAACLDADFATGGGTAVGTNTGDQTIALTGDVTGSGTGTFAASIAAGSVSLAKMADMATASVMYRKTAGTGSPEVQTLATLKTDLGLTGTNSGDETTTTAGALINGATAKTTPVDADFFGLMDSAAANILKKLSWANIKATLKTYTDTLYATIAQVHFVGTTSIAANRASASQALTGITSIDGTAAAWTTARNLAGNSVNGSANVNFANAFICKGTADAGLTGAQFMGALATGIVKNTTTTGVQSIAVAGTDYAAPNQTFYIGTTQVAINRASATLTLAGITLTTPDIGTPSAGNLSSCTADGTNAVGFRHIPQNSQSAAYTCVLTDAGKHILHPSADTTARTFTIPANSSVAYPIGTAITFINQNDGGTITISITTDTMRLAGAGTTGSRTLAANGVATAIKITSTEWIISGTGLT